MTKTLRSTFLLLAGVLLPLGSVAEEPSADAVARELANPNTALASLTFKNTWTAYKGDLDGADDEGGFTTLFQPVLPFPLENGDKIMWRPAVPLVFDMPVFDGSGVDPNGTPTARSVAGFGGFDSESGLGDIAFDLLYAITSETGVLSGYGIIASLPTATEEALGRDKWTLGPEDFLGKLSEKSVLGVLVNHQWDIAGSDDVVDDVSLTTFNLFGVYLPSGGWNVGSFPIISYDWEEEQWTFPVSFAVGRTMVFGGRPWKFQVDFNYFVEQADPFGPDWSISFNVTPVIENFMVDWFK